MSFIFLAFLLSSSTSDVVLKESSRWTQITYDDIPTNQYKFSEEGLTIQVTMSSGPILYILPQPQNIKGLEFSGQMRALPQIKNSKNQGGKKLDDFALRVGVITEGQKRLSFPKKLFAPQWIKILEEKFSKTAKGIGEIHLLNIANSPGPEWNQRTHPKSDLIHEEIVLRAKSPGEFAITGNFNDLPAPVIGLWIGPDGDDTRSEFEVVLNQLKIIQ